MTDKDCIRYLEEYIAEEELYGATAEDLQTYKRALLTFLLADSGNKKIEKVRELYLRERGADADPKTLRALDTALQLRS